jgi:5-methylcytosine-specific restriction endonuclease McrA
MIIAKRKQVEPNVEVAPDASADDADSASGEEESYDPGTDEDNQSSSETASMPIREAVDVVTEQVARGTPTETSSTSSKRTRDDMAIRAEAVGLGSAKRQRDEKIKAAEEAIETAEQELSEAVLAKEEELRLQQEEQERQAREEQHSQAAAELEDSRRRKRAPNRKNHWGTVKRRQTDADGHLRCAICNFWDYRDAPGTQIIDRELRLDHILALELDGRDNDPDNLQILCGMCDNRKTGYDNQKYFEKRATEARDLVRVRATQH